MPISLFFNNTSWHRLNLSVKTVHRCFGKHYPTVKCFCFGRGREALRNTCCLLPACVSCSQRSPCRDHGGWSTGPNPGIRDFLGRSEWGRKATMCSPAGCSANSKQWMLSTARRGCYTLLRTAMLSFTSVSGQQVLLFGNTKYTYILDCT